MELKTKEVLKRLGDLEREIEYIKRDLLQVVEQPRSKTSLFGGVRGGDVTSQGESLVEAQNNIKEAIELYIESF